MWLRFTSEIPDHLKSLGSGSTTATNNLFSEANGNFPTMRALIVGVITQVSYLVQFPGWKDLVTASWLYQASYLSKEGLILISPHAMLISINEEFSICATLCAQLPTELWNWKIGCYTGLSRLEVKSCSVILKSIWEIPMASWKAYQLWTVTFWLLASGAVPYVRVWQ